MLHTNKLKENSTHVSENCNWFLPMTALISVLLSVSTLSAQSQSDLSRSGQWRIAGQDVPTFHNDRARSGIQPKRTALTPSNVNPNLFGKLRSFRVDADVYAQPLYVSKYKMADGRLHNVLFCCHGSRLGLRVRRRRQQSGKRPFVARFTARSTAETYVSLRT